MPIPLRVKKMSLDEIKCKAMEDLEFFKGLVSNATTEASLKKFLRNKGFQVSTQDISALLCVLKYGTITLTARQFLDLVAKPKLKTLSTGGTGATPAVSVVWRC